jgi:hypothetical protein
MGGRRTSSHDSEKFRTRSMEKQRGMAFGFRKTATAVIEPEGWIERIGWDGLDGLDVMDGWIGWDEMD